MLPSTPLTPYMLEILKGRGTQNKSQDAVAHLIDKSSFQVYLATCVSVSVQCEGGSASEYC